MNTMFTPRLPYRMTNHEKLVEQGIARNALPCFDHVFVP